MPLSTADFVHLHVHSEYSLLDGANRLGDLTKYVKSIGQPAVALTDHGVMFGTLEFHKAAMKAGVQPIIGCEVYIVPGSRRDRTPASQRETHHLLLLASSYEGYLNLGRLSSIGYTEGFYYKPRIDFETLAKHSAGLVATTGCLSGLAPRALQAGQEARARDYVRRFIELFGKERFFVELQDHGIREQRLVNSGLITIARDEGLRLVATNDSHYLRREDATLHDLLLCIQTGCCVTDTNRMKFDTNEFYIKTTAEMEALFGDIPEALTNTRLVAEMCRFDMPAKQYHLPNFPCPDGLNEAGYLRQLVWEGAARRYGTRLDSDTALRDRIDFELGVINRMGFDAYFLIVWDFIRHARSVGIPVGPGRGSAAGSVVAYCLAITQLDPLEHGLLFERFLNPDRVSMPDIDVDFCFERRGEVIEYVRRKYGEDCVAQIITFGTMKARSAVRDVARALGMPLQTADRVAKTIPEGPDASLSKAMAESQELKDLVEQDMQIKRLVDTALRLEGSVRNAGTHAAGVVIADRPITDYCALYLAPKEGVVATQYTMEEIEEIGLLKMDFLGIKNLTVIRRVEQWLKEREGIVIDWDEIGYGDRKTYELLAKGGTVGVFQLESEGMTALVRALKPSEFADLTALIALYRPGPLQAGMQHVYVDRKHGRQAVSYDDPILEPILKETYGIILYQEQVMRIAMEMSGFTRGEADVLRKAMGKKLPEVMAKQEAKFIEGAHTKSGVDREKAKFIWDQIVTFAGYGFNKSHSAAYAVVTYQTAYLSANYPLLMTAALLTNEISSSTDGIAKYVAHARELGIDLRPVDINRSRQDFAVEDGAIFYALGAVKGVGMAAARTIVEERERSGHYRSLQDFLLRIPSNTANSRVVEALIKVGAFDSLHKNRAALVAALPELHELAVQHQRDRDGGQFSLFEEAGEGATTTEVPLPRVNEWDAKTRAAFEKEFLGFFLTEHPLMRYRLECESFATHRSSALTPLAETLRGQDSLDVTLVGMVTNVMVRMDKSGNQWAIVSMEDLDGPFEAKAFSKSWRTHKELLVAEAVIQITARLSLFNNRLSIDITNVRPIAELRETTRLVEIQWKASSIDTRGVVALKEICRRHQGKRPVRVAVATPDGLHTVEFLPNGPCRLALTDDAIRELCELPGRPKLRLIP